MNIQLVDCPACGGKVSSQAMACPKCGQPIHPVLKLADKQTVSHQTPFPSHPNLSSQPLNIENGVMSLIGMIVIMLLLFLSIGAPPEANDRVIPMFIIACLGYAGLWGWNTFCALKHNDIGKIIILTFLPFIGIIFCSFLTPKANKTPKEQ